MTKQIQVAIDINDKIENMLVTAIEGGSNYWYLIKETYMVIDEAGKSLAERIFKTVLETGNKIPVYDYESPDDCLGYISFESIVKANELMKKNHPEHFEDMLTENYDAETADVWFQLVVMGEKEWGSNPKAILKYLALRYGGAFF